MKPSLQGSCEEKCLEYSRGYRNESFHYCVKICKRPHFGCKTDLGSRYHLAKTAGRGGALGTLSLPSEKKLVVTSPLMVG